MSVEIYFGADQSVGRNSVSQISAQSPIVSFAP
jgi:hypothetical protein